MIMAKKLKFIEGQMLEYEIYKLVDFYDPILRKPTTPIDFNQMDGKDIAYMSISLMETLNTQQGLGLSANQVGLPYRMFALNMGDKLWALINPRILEVSNTTTKFKEGCLSYKGLYLEIGRPDRVVLEFHAAGGEKLVQEFTGMTATCVFHELDHLDGIMYTDRVSRIKLDAAKRKVKRTIKMMKNFVVPN
jgi:peptide deformylase